MLSSGELIRRARDGGDQSAWSALVDRYGGLVWAVTRAHGLSTADAADVAQTVWLRLVERLDQVSEPDAIAGWLATTTRRECLHLLRRRAPLPLAPEDLPWPQTPQSADPCHIATARDRVQHVAEALRNLPPRCRDLLRLLAVPDITYAETSTALGIPLGSIGPTRARCLAALRARLTDQ